MAAGEVELAGARPAEHREVGAGAELAAEGEGGRAHVGALGAADAEVDPGALPGQQLEFGEADRPRFARDLDALAGEVIELPPADLLRRVHRRDLELVAQHRGEGGAHPRFGYLRHRVRLERLAFGVLGVGDDPERRLAEVFLILGHQLVRRLRGLADQHDEQAGRHRVERAGMADAAGAVEPPHAIHDVVGGDPLRLVDEQHARGFGAGLAHRAENSR